jgi:putative FmdB family regulatory protein
MPVYEYYCEQCQHKYDALRPVSRMDEPTTCPKCDGPGKRQLSAFGFKNGRYGSFFKAGQPNTSPNTSATTPQASPPDETAGQD